DLLERLMVAVNGQQAGDRRAALVQQTPQQVIGLAAGDRQPEVFRGNIFEVVGLIEDNYTVVRKNPALVVRERTDHQVGEEQGVVDDEQVRLVDLPARLEVEALRIVGTAFVQ